MALKKKIRIEDLLKATGQMDGHVTDKNFTSNLMNLVMQFRKVCNHPELFERRDVRSPFSLPQQEYNMARLVYDEGIFKLKERQGHLLYNKFNIWKAENIQRSIWRHKEESKMKKPDENSSDAFAFLRFVDISPGEAENVTLKGLLEKLLHIGRILADPT